MRVRPALRAILLGWLTLSAGCSSGEQPRDEPVEQSTPLPPAEPAPEPKTYAERVAELPSGLSEQQALEALLYSYCGDCHGSDLQGTTVDGAGMYYVDDVELLIKAGKIVPGDAAGSKLVQRMDSMPPMTTGQPPAPLELVQRLAAFIDGLPPASQ